MELTTAYCPVGAGRLAYDRAGSGPVVVFLHGIGGNRRNWTDQLYDLGTEYTCIAWDAMGYGDSSETIDASRFEHFAEELHVLLNELRVERAHLVGLSMGGHIVQNFYRLHPDRVATLTLAASSAGMGTLSPSARQDFVARRAEPLKNGQSTADTAAAMVNILVGRGATPAVRERLRASLAAVRKDSYVQTVHAILTTDFRTLLPMIGVPTLVIVGEDDRVLPVPESDYLARHIPGATLSVLKGVGHLCNMEAPEEFDAVLKEFLARHKDEATTL